MKVGVFELANAMQSPMVEEFTDEYEKAGIKPTFTSFTDKATAHFALLGGKVDVLTGSVDAHASIADENGPDVRVVAGYYQGLNFIMLVPPDSPVGRYTGPESLKQLEGLTIGDWGDNASRWFLEILLAEAGLPPDYVKYKQLPVSAAGVAAFRRGAVDVIIQSDPGAHQLIAKDWGRIFLDLRSDDTPLRGLPNGAFNVRLDEIEKNRDLYERFVRATCEGIRTIKASPDEASELLASLLGADSTPAILDGIKADIALYGTEFNKDKVDFWLKTLHEQHGQFSRVYTYDDTVAPGFDSVMNC